MKENSSQRLKKHTYFIVYFTNLFNNTVFEPLVEAPFLHFSHLTDFSLLTFSVLEGQRLFQLLQYRLGKA